VAVPTPYPLFPVRSLFACLPFPLFFPYPFPNLEPPSPLLRPPAQSPLSAFSARRISRKTEKRGKTGNPTKPVSEAVTALLLPPPPAARALASRIRPIFPHFPKDFPNLSHSFPILSTPPGPTQPFPEAPWANRPFRGFPKNEILDFGHIWENPGNQAGNQAKSLPSALAPLPQRGRHPARSAAKGG
jgi:hypothetical protein